MWLVALIVANESVWCDDSGCGMAEREWFIEGNEHNNDASTINKLAKCILVHTRQMMGTIQMSFICNLSESSFEFDMFWKAQKYRAIYYYTCTATNIYLSLWRWTWRWISWWRFISCDKRVGHIYRHFTVWTCWTKRVIQFRCAKLQTKQQKNESFLPPPPGLWFIHTYHFLDSPTAWWSFLNIVRPVRCCRCDDQWCPILYNHQSCNVMLKNRPLPVRQYLSRIVVVACEKQSKKTQLN